MTAYTPEASRQVDDLIQHYEDRQRPEAIRALLTAMDQAEGKIEREVLGQCLSDQDPVERIAMVAWQPTGRDPVGWLNRQRLKPHSLNHFVKQIEREFQAAERVLERNFP